MSTPQNTVPIIVVLDAQLNEYQEEVMAQVREDEHPPLKEGVTTESFLTAMAGYTHACLRGLTDTVLWYEEFLEGAFADPEDANKYLVEYADKYSEYF